MGSNFCELKRHKFVLICMIIYNAYILCNFKLLYNHFCVEPLNTQTIFERKTKMQFTRLSMAFWNF